MTKYIVYNDIHFMAPHNMAMFIENGPNVILNGDIVDHQNCKKKELQVSKNLITAFKIAFKDRYILGNHELEAAPCQGYYKDNGVLFRHGDWEFWGKKKRDAYMKRATPGAGWFKRHILVRSFGWLRRIWTARYSRDFKKRCLKMCLHHGCEVIVLGHKHPRKKADFIYSGIRIIVLPRGKNLLEL